MRLDTYIKVYISRLLPRSLYVELLAFFLVYRGRRCCRIANDRGSVLSPSCCIECSLTARRHNTSTRNPPLKAPTCYSDRDSENGGGCSNRKPSRLHGRWYFGRRSGRGKGGTGSEARAARRLKVKAAGGEKKARCRSFWAKEN